MGDLSLSAFLNAYTRFTACGGVSEAIFSDNGRQLVAASERISVTWHFTIPRATWKSGVYETVIGLVKAAMKKCIGKRSLKVDKFANTVIRIEGILNTRPITPVDNDTMDNLRPVDFINLKVVMLSREDSLFAQSDHGFPRFTGRRKNLQFFYRKIKKKRKQIPVQMDKTISSDVERKRRQKTASKEKADRKKPRAGEVVFIEDETTPRTRWKLGRIIELITNNRGEITHAKVRLTKDQVGEFIKFVKRSISQLYPLETELVRVDKSTSISKQPTKESTTKSDRNLKEKAFEEEKVHSNMTTMATVKKEKNEINASSKLKPS